MSLQRFWFEFLADPFEPLPWGTQIGCGVTAYDQDDALRMMAGKVFPNRESPKITKCVEGIDVSTLDEDKVIPNMVAPVKRGVWFPLGYQA